ncbi:monocarboxylate transporter 12-like [Amphiura filiformis]|uniref:monocarboxylate transporter 12-like n=1 Tax=Amphiura filiformis TaxID=82378 RepID=UPI003B225FBE
MQEENKWCWIVVTGSHLAQALSIGGCSILGIMLNAWVYDFGVTVQEVSTIFALIPICDGVASFVAGILCGRLGYRAVAIIGGVVTSLGYFATSFAQSLSQLYIFLGVITSCGVGIAHTPSVMVLGSYFTTSERLILANGISFTGISTGTLLLPPLLEYLYSQYGWRRGTLVFSAFTMNLIICGALYRPYSKVKTAKGTPKQPATAKNECSRKFTGPPLHRNIHFILSVFVVGLTAMVAFGGYVYIIPRATSVGISSFEATLLVTISGVSGAIGSLGHSIIITRKYVTTQTMFCISTIVCALSLFTNPLSDHMAFLVVNVCIFTLTLAIITTLITNPIPRMIVDWSTPSLVDPAIGIVFFTSALAQTLGMILAGSLHHASGSFTVPYLAFGVILCLAAVLFIPIFKLMRDMDRSKKMATDV